MISVEYVQISVTFFRVLWLRVLHFLTNRIERKYTRIMRISAVFFLCTENSVHENESLNYFVIGANPFYPRLFVFYSFFDEITVVPEPKSAKVELCLRGESE